MAFLKKLIFLLFVVFCTSATVILSSWCIYVYYLDLDMTIVTYKRLHQSKEAIYPSISFCLYQPYIKNNFQQYGDNTANATSYRNFLTGAFWSKEFIGIDYDDVTLNIGDYFLGYSIYETNLATARKYTFKDKDIEISLLI